MVVIRPVRIHCTIRIVPSGRHKCSSGTRAPLHGCTRTGTRAARARMHQRVARGTSVYTCVFVTASIVRDARRKFSPPSLSHVGRETRGSGQCDWHGVEVRGRRPWQLSKRDQQLSSRRAERNHTFTLSDEANRCRHTHVCRAGAAGDDGHNCLCPVLHNR